MLKTFAKIGAAAVLSLSSFVHGQAMPTATGHGQLQVGGGVTMGKPDYGEDYIGGVSIFADYDFTAHLGLEADAHIVNLRTPQDSAENTYLVGPRYVWHKNRFSPYGKVLVGEGSLVIQETQDNPGK